MSKLLYTALLVLFLVPMTFAEDPKADAPQADAPVAEVENADTTKTEAKDKEASTDEEAPQAEATKAAKPECDEILAKVKDAKAVHHADYKAKGKAFFNWRKYNRELHSMSYLNTDKPLADSVQKCQEEDKPGKDFCKGVMKEYDKISPKEKAAKEKLDAAEEKSNKSRLNYNMLLEEAHEMNCLVNQQ